MNAPILHPDVQTYIDQNLNSDISKLIFKGSPFKDITIQDLANQILCKKKCEKKLPSWFHTKNIYYPEKINIEQTSSEITASYKANIISGDSLIDITAGFGVDCAAFSKKFKQVTHCELNKNLSTIVKHNYQQLKIDNCKVVSGDGLDYLKNTTEKFDCIYIDPSRRSDAKGKVFLLADCLPNVPDNLDFLFTKTNCILIKNSPILDITSAINELQFVKEIHVVAIQNEVKELLFVLEKQFVNDIQLKTVNITKNKNELFDFQYNKSETSEYSIPQEFLYEPNAAILKSGGFHEIGNQFQLKKLHQHSHLYTNNSLRDFPGRTFKIEQVISYDKKLLKKYVKENKANITTRNFPETVSQIRKKTSIKDGGSLYLFFTTNIHNQFIVIICTQIFKN